MVDSYRSVLEDMTEAQGKLLTQFRASLGVELNPHRHTDELLFKFLRAKNFHLKAAKKVFLENYYNRIMFGVNTLLDTYQKPEVAAKYESTSLLGFARDGTLIRYTAAGRLDFYGFIMSMSCLDLCLYFSYFMEHDIRALEEENRKTGRNVTEVTYIIDLEGFSLQQVCHKNVVEMGLDYVRLIQDCYPEIWRRVLVVNAPKIFPTAYNLFKPVIRATIKEKIKVVDKGSTRSTLLKYIDAEVLPSFLGGNRLDSKGDPRCTEFITFGGKVPDKLYCVNSERLLSASEPGVRCVEIGPRCMFNVCAVVREAGSTLHFKARAEGGSIAFSVLYKELTPDNEPPELPGETEFLDESASGFRYKQVSVEIRCQMHCTQEAGLIQAPWPGIYIARLSNASNWFTPRKVYFHYTVTPPDHQRAP